MDFARQLVERQQLVLFHDSPDFVAAQHTLIVERGVSFAAFDSSGQAMRTAYASNIFAPQPRYLVIT